MKKVEFQAAVKRAFSGENLTQFDDSVMYGCALPGFKPVVATEGAVARFIRYQAQFFNGGQDSVEIDSLYRTFVISGRVTIL